MTDIETVSILFLTKNAGPEFNRVLDRIDTQKTAKDVEIIVVDSGSLDGTVKRAAAYADTLVEIDPEEFHHGRTRNLAADKATGDAYIYLTQDALPMDNSWLESLVEPLTNDGAGAAYGRQIAYPEAKPMDKFFYSYFYPEDRQRLTSSDVDDRREFYLENIFISDVAAAISAKAFDDVRFREDTPMSEDKDFAFRALEQGYDLVYEPSAAVYHSHDYSIPELFKRRFKDGKAYATIAGEGDGNFTGEGLQYLRKEIAFLVREGHLCWVPYALAYDFTYFLGFQTGKAVGSF
jgi:rhamnosyltransferase